MKAILAAVLSLGISACGTATTDNPQTMSAADNKVKTMYEAKQDSATFEFRGTVQFVTLEGGFYAIYADDGRKFMPQNLGAAHRKPGLVVQVKGRILKGVITFQQHGEVLQIISIEMVDDSQVNGKAIK
ncbi:MAG: hypothetical protein ACI965_000390 [Paraglaciecola sp.]|jgi:hypothetical protein